VFRFEKNAQTYVTPDFVVEDIDPLNLPLLFAGDNVDQNTISIYGKGAFHGISMIAAFTQWRQKQVILSAG
jgi:hypothetical protein